MSSDRPRRQTSLPDRRKNDDDREGETSAHDSYPLLDGGES